MKRVYLFIFGVALIVAFVMGHSVASTQAELEMAKYKLEQAEAFKVSLKKEQEKYAAKEENLIKRFKSDSDHYTDRMRQLERKLKSRTDCQAVTSERNRSVKLAIEGERLLKEADRIIEAIK